MDINVARTFLEVVKTGSFVNAAANLNLTQTAVSARIRYEKNMDRQWSSNKLAQSYSAASGSSVRTSWYRYGNVPDEQLRCPGPRNCRRNWCGV